MRCKKSYYQDIASSLRTILNYIVTDMEKKPRSFKIGVFSIFIVVCFLTILYSAIQLAPIIFIQLAEYDVGDVDLILTPVSAQNDTRLAADTNNLIFNFLNTTQISNELNGNTYIRGESSRWVLPVKISDPNIAQSNILYAYLLIINSQEEIDIGIGRNLDEGPIGKGQAWLSYSASLMLNGHEGDYFHFNSWLIN